MLQSLDRLHVPDLARPVLLGLVHTGSELPQGAPTSSGIGEQVLHRLDCRLDGFLRPHGVTYTRYADDITVSGGRKLQGRMQEMVYKIIADEGWILNDKGGLYGPTERHEMLGLVVNADPITSPGYIGRLRHLLRLVRRREAHLPPAKIRRIRGQIEWVRATSPLAAERLLVLLEDVAITPPARPTNES